VFNGIEWVTTAPPNITGKYFVSGTVYRALTPILANLNPVKWKGIWTANSPCVSSVEWSWAAAAYSTFNTDLASIQVKAADGNNTTPFNNTHSAGAPENMLSYCIAGARSLSTSDYTGSFSNPITRIPCNTGGTCGSTPVIRIGDPVENTEPVILQISPDFNFKAYPNPFSSKATIEFGRNDKPDHVIVNVYTMEGRRVATIFDDEIEQGKIYQAEFDAADLKNGIYLYIISGSDFKENGKLILNR
jgi:hypothetical protein